MMHYQPRTGAVDRLAAVDIGSNTIRLVVAEPLPGGQFRVVDEERETTRLAQGVSRNGQLDERAIATTVDGLRRFRQLAEGLGVTRLQTIATCAVREAENRDLFVKCVAEETGLDVTVISSKQEGLYAFRSVQCAFDISDQNIAVVDIGGGSTEVVFASAGHVEDISSTRLGAVRLMELYGHRDSLFGEDYCRLVRQIDRELKMRVQRPPFSPQMLYGTGGTFTALASMILAARKEDAQSIWGYRVSRADVRHMLDRLKNMTVKERRGLPGLNADRADIILS